MPAASLLPHPCVLDAGLAIEIPLAGGVRRFHALWLRDNAQDAATRSPGNGQRLITILDIPAETRITDAYWIESGLSIAFAPEGKVVVFRPDWLARHAYDKPAPTAPGWTGLHVTRWDAAMAGAVEADPYEAVRDSAAARRRWLKAVRHFGFARLTDVPRTEGMVCDVAQLFGYVRETNYGRWFDVKTEVNPSNLAYTNLGLQSHTDNPYRDPAPSLQLLTCLEATTDGGASVVVDGFKIAERIQQQSPRSFEMLTRYCARFDYAGAKGIRLSSRRPLIELGPDGELISVRFNNRSASAFSDIPYDDMAAYYEAYRLMATLVEDPDLAFTFQLAPGDLFIVDNWRVLHGRTPITGTGSRLLQGCYADRDGLFSTLAALEDDVEDVHPLLGKLRLGA